MGIQVAPNGEACGAVVTGVDLSQPVADDVIAEMREAWLEHHVLIFPNQPLDDDDLERVSQYFGEFGVDPFIKPLEKHENIIAIQREADETSPIFADIWHTDWSFQPLPPAGTFLFSVDIPPEGGDTLFANQHLALEQMPEDLRQRLEGKNAIHSAMMGYSKNGAYGDKDEGRSMQIEASEDALEQQLHPIIRKHPESGKEAIFGTAIAYIIGVDGMAQKDGMDLLMELQKWQTQDEFVYRHKWEKDMLVIWDNRSVLHKATGGYEGHRRELHRTTVADDPSRHRFAQAQATSNQSSTEDASSERTKISIASAADIEATLTKAVDAYGGFANPVQFVFGETAAFHILGKTVKPGQDKADCTISMSVEDFGSIANADLDVMGAVMAGKVKVEGDSSIAISIQGLF